MQLYFFNGRASITPGPPAGEWVWGDEGLAGLDSFCFLGIEYSSDGSWDKHIKTLITCKRQKLGGLHTDLYNFALDLRTPRHILMGVI